MVPSGKIMSLKSYRLLKACCGHLEPMGSTIFTSHPFSDPVGWLEVKKTGPQFESMRFTGDMIGTFMAWLSDTEAGGNTIYCYPGW